MLTAFISYSGLDQEFAAHLNNALQAAGIKTFYFPDSSVPGEKLHHMMRDNVNRYDKVIFICSTSSLVRPGVLNELEESLAREAREGGEQILIPISLDDYVFTGWSPKRQGLKQAILDRVVGNFIGADKDEKKFADGVAKLLETLGASPNLNTINSEIILNLRDRGASCLVTMRRSFISYIKRDRLLYSGMNSTGTIRPVSTTFGHIAPMVTEGGNRAIPVTFDDSLPVNELITHELTVEHINAFLEETESYSVHRLVNAERFSITINFPEDRLVKDAGIIINEVGRKVADKLPVEISPDNRQATFSADFSKSGTYYNLTWEW